MTRSVPPPLPYLTSFLFECWMSIYLILLQSSHTANSVMLAIIFACFLPSFNGQYPGLTDSTVNEAPETSYEEQESGNNYGKPTVPLAPPRVPTRNGPSLGYRPPPPPIRRDAKSSGKCLFDQNSWRFEPQTAIANAIMFERTTGSSCEECVKRCIQLQDLNSEWVCRSLTFDHQWKICDLFAVNGTNPPHFLTEFMARDYLEYLQVGSSPDVHSAEYSVIADAGKKVYPTSNVHLTEYSAIADAGEKEVYPASDVHSTEYSAIADAGKKEVYPASDVHSTEYSAIADAGKKEVYPASDVHSTEYSAIADTGKKEVYPASDVHSTEYSAIVDASKKELSSQTAPQSMEIAETQYGLDSTRSYKAIHRKSTGKSSEKFCRNGDVTRYAMILNHERLNSSTDTQVVKGESLRECARACDQDETFTCSSVISRGRECELSVSRAVHKSNDDFVFNENSTYLEKFCFPKGSAEATEKLWPTVLDHILVGHVMEVIDAPSLIECMTACLQAEQEFLFVCRSAMWYPNDEDQNCLLNTETRETHPKVFVAEDQGARMFYFEVPRTRSKKEISDVFRDDPVEDDYTRWSSCSSSNLQHRYLKCKEQTDVRKCPQQTKFCKQASNTLRKGKCIAVRDSNGRKKCPHGIRRVPDGHSEYCKNPIDCNS